MVTSDAYYHASKIPTIDVDEPVGIGEELFWKDTPFLLSQTPPSLQTKWGSFSHAFHTESPTFFTTFNPTFHPHSRVAQPVDRGGCLLSINVVISTSGPWSCARWCTTQFVKALGRSVFPLVHKTTTITSLLLKIHFHCKLWTTSWMVSQAEISIASGPSLSTPMVRWPVKAAWWMACLLGCGRVTVILEN